MRLTWKLAKNTGNIQIRTDEPDGQWVADCESVDYAQLITFCVNACDSIANPQLVIPKILEALRVIADHATVAFISNRLGAHVKCEQMREIALNALAAAEGLVTTEAVDAAIRAAEGGAK